MNVYHLVAGLNEHDTIELLEGIASKYEYGSELRYVMDDALNVFRAHRREHLADTIEVSVEEIDMVKRGEFAKAVRSVKDRSPDIALADAYDVLRPYRGF